MKFLIYFLTPREQRNPVRGCALTSPQVFLHHWPQSIVQIAKIKDSDGTLHPIAGTSTKDIDSWYV